MTTSPSTNPATGASAGLPAGAGMSPLQVQKALTKVAKALGNAAPELNALDGKLGDGDLGATLEKCAINVVTTFETTPAAATLSDLFKTAAMACAKASGSSFGTLLAQALLVAAKETKDGPATLTLPTLATILQKAGETLSQRGGAVLGDKTVLDPLAAVAQALSDATSLAEAPRLALDATQHTLTQFRDRPNKIGRARMFAERSKGMDDPGMIAFLRMVEAL